MILKKAELDRLAALYSRDMNVSIASQYPDRLSRRFMDIVTLEDIASIPSLFEQSVLKRILSELTPTRRQG